MAPISKWAKGLLSPVYEKWREKGRRDGFTSHPSVAWRTS